MPAAAPDVTVCVPAYQSAAFVADTLRSVQQQTHAGLVVNVSVDLSSDDTAKVCRAFAAGDDRFRVFAQERRLGWIGNANFLLDRVDTEFFFILPHDDTVEPDYVEALQAALLHEPAAVLAFADTDKDAGPWRDDAWDRLRSAPEVRIQAFLAAIRPGLPWRGLTRSRVLHDGRRMQGAFDGFEAHVTWLVELLCLGPFVHVPRVLYHGGPPRRSVTRGWAAWPQEMKMAAAVEHAVQCLRIITRLPDFGESTYSLALACALRALQRSRLARGVPLVAPPSRHDDLVLLAGILGRALGLPPMGAEEMARLRQSFGPRKMTASLIRADLRRLQGLGMEGDAAAWQEALALDPSGSEPAVRGEALHDDVDRSRRRRRAFEAAERGALLAPEDARTLLDLAFQLTKTRQYDRAIDVARKVLQINEQLPEAHYCLAAILRKHGDQEQAIAAARRALELDPHSAATLALLAKLQRRTQESKR